jgi:hypothetical protein
MVKRRILIVEKNGGKKIGVKIGVRHHFRGTNYKYDK